MANEHRCELPQAGYELSRLKAMHSQILNSIDNYDTIAGKFLNTMISAFYFDTNVHDTKTLRDGKLIVEGTSVMFLFKDVDDKYKKFIVFDLNYESSKGNLAYKYHIPDNIDDESFNIKSITALHDIIKEPILDRFRVIVDYCSVWDGEGILTSKAYINMDTKEVDILQTYDPDEIFDEDGDPFECEILKEEYIEFADGTRKPCHDRFSVDEHTDWNPNTDFWYN